MLLHPNSLLQLAALAVVAALALGFVAAPLTIVLSRFKLERPWTYPLFGMLAGTVLSAAANWLTSHSGYSAGDSTAQIIEIVAGAFAGLAGGWVWWLMYRRLSSAHRETTEFSA
jgi:hypothetical protein